MNSNAIFFRAKEHLIFLTDLEEMLLELDWDKLLDDFPQIMFAANVGPSSNFPY